MLNYQSSTECISHTIYVHRYMYKLFWNAERQNVKANHKLRYISTVPEETLEMKVQFIIVFVQFSSESLNQRLVFVQTGWFKRNEWYIHKCKTFNLPTSEICYVEVVLLCLLPQLLHLPRLAAVVLQVPRGHLEARQLRHSLQNHPQRLLIKVHRLLARKKKIGWLQVKKVQRGKPWQMQVWGVM